MNAGRFLSRTRGATNPDASRADIRCYDPLGIFVRRITEEQAGRVVESGEGAWVNGAIRLGKRMTAPLVESLSNETIRKIQSTVRG